MKQPKRVNRATLIKLLAFAVQGWREEYVAARAFSSGTPRSHKQPPDIRYVAARGAVQLERALNRARRGGRS